MHVVDVYGRYFYNRMFHGTSESEGKENADNVPLPFIHSPASRQKSVSAHSRESLPEQQTYDYQKIL